MSAGVTRAESVYYVHAEPLRRKPVITRRRIISVYKSMKWLDDVMHYMHCNVIYCGVKMVDDDTRSMAPDAQISYCLPL